MRFILILMLAIFCACSKARAPMKQTVRINLSEDPTSLDPKKARDFCSWTILHMLFEGLSRMSSEGKVELALADSVTLSENRLTYTFHLRKSQWSNSDFLSASDFVNSWKAILDPQFPTDIAYHFFCIKNARLVKAGKLPLNEVGIRVIDADTLLIELEEPTPYFLDLLTMSPFFPTHSKDVSIWNGPFVLESWSHSNSLLLSKNPTYWEADKVEIQKLELAVASADTGLRLFEEGNLDWIGSPLSTIPFDAVSALKEARTLQISPFAATCFFRTNTSPEIKGAPNPLSDVRFRRALALSLDREAIVRHILQAGQKPARSLVPPEISTAEIAPFSDTNREEAFTLLQEVKKQFNLTKPLCLSYHNNERNAAIAQAVQNQWKEALGLSIELEAVEPKTYFQRISKRDFQLATGSWTADYNDPINFLEVFKFKDNGTNNTGWEKREYIDLLNRSVLCKTSEERNGLLFEAETILMEEMPIIPLFHFSMNYLKNENLKGVSLSPLGQIDFRWAHWEEKK